MGINSYDNCVSVPISRLLTVFRHLFSKVGTFNQEKVLHDMIVKTDGAFAALDKIYPSPLLGDGLPIRGAQATRLPAHLPLVAVAHVAAVPGRVAVVAGVGGVGHVVRGVGAQSAALVGDIV